MNDRELVELAAKSSGHEIIGWCAGRLGKDWAELSDTSKWNPLEDDGDAFRLACSLGLIVYPVARTMTGAACSAVADVNGGRLSEAGHASLDVRAATRLAIVYAAAMLAK